MTEEAKSMGKVTLRREVAEALDSVRHLRNEEIIEFHVKHYRQWRNKELNDLSTDRLCQALYYGYEVKTTPEESVKNYYLKMKQASHSGYGSGRAISIVEGIETTLNLLGIKIEGVNA